MTALRYSKWACRASQTVTSPACGALNVPACLLSYCVNRNESREGRSISTAAVSRVRLTHSGNEDSFKPTEAFKG